VHDFWNNIALNPLEDEEFVMVVIQHRALLW